MMLRVTWFLFIHLMVLSECFGQIDSVFLYNESAPYGPLDITIWRSENDYYFLEDGKTFSFRERDGVRTNNYFDMTAWDSSPYKQGTVKRKTDQGDLFIMNYRYLVPPNYSSSHQGGYPLVILLHGLQERGNCAGSGCYHATTNYSPNENSPSAPTNSNSQLLNNDYNLAHGGSNYLEASLINGSVQPGDANAPARGFPGFVLFPQNLNGWDGASAQDALRLLRLFIKANNIDVNRIYLNGVSNGGHGAFEVLKRAPWLFASAILFSPADDGDVISQNLQSTISDVPLWIFQGGLDKKPLASYTESYIRELREAGANVRYTLYPELGHGTWNKAFSEPDFFSWMLGQSQQDIHVFSGKAAICKTTGRGATLSLPRGFSGYQWEYNGAIIQGATEYKMVATEAGNYRGRYTNNNNQQHWSKAITVTEKNPLAPEIVTTNTLLLKDPNGANEAVLKAEGQAETYLWYRNSKKLDFESRQDDTLNIVRILSSFGDGLYTLVVSDFDGCTSPPSEAKAIFFDDHAALSLPSPSSLKLTHVSPSEIALSWVDASDNESGFEIWFKEVSNQSSTQWTLVTISPRNTTTYTSQGLKPSTRYEYMIRAISSNSRSEYTSPVGIETSQDSLAPSIPGNLTANIISADEIQLSWQPSTDNSAIEEYIVSINGDTVETNSIDTVFILSPYIVNADYSISVQAKDLGENLSDHTKSIEIKTQVSGLFYQHSTGDWKSVEEIDWTIREFEGRVENFTLKPKTQEDFYNIRFDGYLSIVKEGVYQFRVSSDDGSRLHLDDTTIIVNDGIHNLATVTAPIQLLSEGPHRISLDFFDNVSTDSVAVEYKGRDTGDKWIAIPNDKLTSSLSTDNEESLDDPLGFAVFPNPVTGEIINIKFDGTTKNRVTVSMHAVTGHNVFSTAVDPVENYITIKLPTPENGLYILRVSDGARSTTTKVIINR